MRLSKWIGTFVLAGAIAGGPMGAGAFEQAKFDAGLFKDAQSSGKSILVHVTAPWCPTCKAQHQALDSLGKKPEFKKVAIFDVDFDTQADVMKSFKANSQSTLIAFKGAEETGRLVGATKADAIETLIKSATK